MSGGRDVVAGVSSLCSPGGGRRGLRRGGGKESGLVARVQYSWLGGRTGRRAVTRIRLPAITILGIAPSVKILSLFWDVWAATLLGTCLHTYVYGKPY